MSRFHATLPSSNKMKKLCQPNNDWHTSLQTLCLFIAVGIVSFILFCISDLVTEAVSFITTGFFNGTLATQDWVWSTAFSAFISTSAILSLTIFGKVYLLSRFGPPTYVHSFVIDLPQIFAIPLCQNYMTHQVTDDSWLLDTDGKRVIGLMQETCHSSTYLELTTMAIEQERTLIVVRAATVPTGRAALLSGFFCDFGKCREAACSAMAIFSSYISHCRLQDINTVFARKTDAVSIGWCPPPMHIKTNQFQEEFSCKT